MVNFNNTCAKQAEHEVLALITLLGKLSHSEEAADFFHVDILQSSYQVGQ